MKKKQTVIKDYFKNISERINNNIVEKRNQNINYEETIFITNATFNKLCESLETNYFIKDKYIEETIEEIFSKLNNNNIYKEYEKHKKKLKIAFKIITNDINDLINNIYIDVKIVDDYKKLYKDELPCFHKDCNCHLMLSPYKNKIFINIIVNGEKIMVDGEILLYKKYNKIIERLRQNYNKKTEKSYYNESGDSIVEVSNICIPNSGVNSDLTFDVLEKQIINEINNKENTFISLCNILAYKMNKTNIVLPKILARKFGLRPCYKCYN